MNAWKGFWTQFQHVFLEACIHQQEILRCQQGVGELKLILTLSTWRWSQILQVKGSVPQDNSSLQIPVASPGFHLCFWATGFRLEVSTTLSSGSINLLEWLTQELRETCLLTRLPIYYKKILKDTNQQPDKEIYIGWGPKQRIFCPCGTWNSAPWHVEVF